MDGYTPSITFISAGFMGARSHLMLRVFGGGAGRDGNVRADRTEVGGPFEVYTIALFASDFDEVEKWADFNKRDVRIEDLNLNMIDRGK